MRFVFILAFCIASHAQGLTLRNPVFLAAVSGGGSGGGTSGGGGSFPGTAPTEYWDFDEASGDRIGEVIGIHLAASAEIGSAAGLQNNCVTFQSGAPAVMGLLSTSDTTDLAYSTGADWSVAYWYKSASFNTGYDSPQVEHWLTDSMHNYYGSWYFDLQFNVAVDDASGDDSEFLHTWSESNGTWHLVVFTYDASAGVIEMFINTASEGTGTGTVTMVSATHGYFEIGNSFSVNANGGSIDELALWLNYELTPTDITWLYNSGAGRAYSDF
jgi:hypothetical protein